MAQSEEHYRAAAHSLGEGFLGSKFGQSNLDQADVSKIHRIEAFKENAILLAGDHAEHMGVMDRGAQSAKSNVSAQEKRAKEAKRSMDNVLFLSLLQQRSAELAADIANMEADFETQYGDAWRETIANKILDPDEIPERQDGESMADYRERLEGVLIERMIDQVAGEIRPEFANNPETAEYAKWAKAEYDKANVDSKIDQANEIENNPDLTRAEKDAQHQTNFEEMDQSVFEGVLRNHETDANAVEVARIEVDDRADAAIASVSASTSIAGF